MAHGLRITRKDIEMAERHLSRRDPATSATKGKAMHQARQTAEIGVAAFGMGLLKGRFGPIQVGPVPVDLLAFVLLSIGGYSGVAGKFSDDVHNFADGLGAGYAHTLGAGIGGMLRVKAGQPLFTSSGVSEDYVSGALSSGSSPLTEAELRAMAQAVR